MPVSLERINPLNISAQDRIDLEKVYLDYPAEERFADILTLLESDKHCTLYVARFNARLLGALSLGTQTDSKEARIGHLCVRAITRQRHVARDLLRLLMLEQPDLQYNFHSCISDSALTALFINAGFKEENGQFTYKPG
jgi:predicted GNAT family N-acyltransferase